MRRIRLVAALAALLCLPAWAQMRGARGGGPRPAGVMHGPVMPARSNGSFGHGFIRNGFGRPGAFPFHHHHHHHLFFGAGFGFNSLAFAYPGWYWDYPADYSDYDQSYRQSQQVQEYQLQMMNSQQQIEQRIDALEERLDRLLEQRSAPAPQPQAKSEPSQPAVLVYKDGHKQEVQNYAIVGQTIWVLNEQQAKKVPLSAIDLNATRKANEDRDVDFALPTSSS